MVTTLSSEAYTLVYLENSYDTWYAEASEDETILARMYTQNPQTSSKYGGWKENGIVRYNELQARVQKERKSIASKSLEKDYQAYAAIAYTRNGRLRLVEKSQEMAVTSDLYATDLGESEDDDVDESGGDDSTQIEQQS